MKRKFVYSHWINQNRLKNRFDEGHSSREIEEFRGPGKNAFFDFINNVLKNFFSLCSNIKGNTKIGTYRIGFLDFKGRKTKIFNKETRTGAKKSLRFRKINFLSRVFTIGV